MYKLSGGVRQWCVPDSNRAVEEVRKGFLPLDHAQGIGYFWNFGIITFLVVDESAPLFQEVLDDGIPSYTTRCSISSYRVLVAHQVTGCE